MKLILIGGDLASGKSTYSHIIGSKYNIMVINKDILKEILGDNILVNNREENKKLSKISFDIIKYLILSNKDKLIIESNFKPYEMNEIKDIVEKNNIEVLSIVLKGDNEILHKRFLDRLNDNRHYVHKSQNFSNIEDFIRTLEELRNVKYLGKIINVNSSNFDYQNDEEIFIKISEFIEG